MFRTPEVARFFAAWQGLRAGADIPHYRTLFHDLPHEMIPQLMIFEPTPPDGQETGARADEMRFIVRFMGTRFVDLWNQDITGRDAVEFVSPKVANAARRNLTFIFNQPCGLVAMGLYTMASRTDAAVESLWLPVGNDPGRPQRLLNFGQELRPPYQLDDVRLDVAKREWVDIGHGVPKRRPTQ